jgi:hypothetical protein
MAKKRISIDIGSDVQKMGRLLRSTNNDREVLRRLIQGDLAKELSKAKIRLDYYASEDFSRNDIVADIKGIIMTILNRDFRDRFQNIFVANDFQSSTSESYEYNFDNSSSSDYKYESHTGTERGTFSDKETGTAMGSDTSFSGLVTKEFENLLFGSLISERVIQLITTHVAKTLEFAKQQMR